MANVTLSRLRHSAGPVYGLGGVGLAGIVTPGTSTYPSQDGTFTIVRGTGAHYGNGLINGMIIAGGSVGGFYDLDDNNTGSLLDLNTSGRYRVGRELQAFIDATPTSPEYLQFEKDQRAAEEIANPKLGAYDAALRKWAQTQQPPVQVDPLFGFATNFDMSQAPDYVQAAYADFTGHPIPQAPPPPPGPAKYLVAGITFGDDGTVYDINGQGNPQGLHLSAAEVQSLKTTGALPPGDTFGQTATQHPATAPSSPTVPSLAPPTTNPTAQPTGPTTAAPGSGATSATLAVPSSGASDATPSIPQVATTLAPLSTTPTTTPTTGGGIGDTLSHIPWYVWAGIAGVFLLSRKRT